MKRAHRHFLSSSATAASCTSCCGLPWQRSLSLSVASSSLALLLQRRTMMYHPCTPLLLAQQTPAAAQQPPPPQQKSKKFHQKQRAASYRSSPEQKEAFNRYIKEQLNPSQQAVVTFPFTSSATRGDSSSSGNLSDHIDTTATSTSRTHASPSTEAATHRTTNAQTNTTAVVVVAGAGTGKTRVITSRISHLILNGYGSDTPTILNSDAGYADNSSPSRSGLPTSSSLVISNRSSSAAATATTGRVNPSSIVALTFTKKAAEEMKERIRADVRKYFSLQQHQHLQQPQSLLPSSLVASSSSGVVGVKEKEGDTAAVENDDEFPFIGTFHAYCLKLLRQHPVLVHHLFTLTESLLSSTEGDGGQPNSNKNGGSSRKNSRSGKNTVARTSSCGTDDDFGPAYRTSSSSSSTQYSSSSNSSNNSSNSDTTVLQPKSKHKGFFTVLDRTDQEKLIRKIVKDIYVQQQQHQKPPLSPSQYLLAITRLKSDLLLKYFHQRHHHHHRQRRCCRFSNHRHQRNNNSGGNVGTFTTAACKEETSVFTEEAPSTSSSLMIEWLVLKEYEKRKQHSFALDFDDLLLSVLAGFYEYPTTFAARVHAQLRHLLVDEYQDTNDVQHELVKKMSLSTTTTTPKIVTSHHHHHHREKKGAETIEEKETEEEKKKKKEQEEDVRIHLDSLCVVGDENQSIYGFRGAKVDNIRDFIEDFNSIIATHTTTTATATPSPGSATGPRSNCTSRTSSGVKVIKLEQNYRSAQVILDVANTVIRNNHPPLPHNHNQNGSCSSGGGGGPPVVELWSTKTKNKKMDKHTAVRYLEHSGGEEEEADALAILAQTLLLMRSEEGTSPPSASKESLIAPNVAATTGEPRQQLVVVNGETTRLKKPLVMTESQDNKNEAEKGVSTNAEKQAEVPVETIAILYRTNLQSRAIEQALLRRGVPYKIHRQTRFFEKKVVKLTLDYLRLVINPFDRMTLLRVINTPKRGLGNRFQESLMLRWERHPEWTYKELLASFMIEEEEKAETTTKAMKEKQKTSLKGSSSSSAPNNNKSTKKMKKTTTSQKILHLQHFLAMFNGLNATSPPSKCLAQILDALGGIVGSAGDDDNIEIDVSMDEEQRNQREAAERDIADLKQFVSIFERKAKLQRLPATVEELLYEIAVEEGAPTTVTPTSSPTNITTTTTATPSTTPDCNSSSNNGNPTPTTTMKSISAAAGSLVEQQQEEPPLHQQHQSLPTRQHQRQPIVQLLTLHAAKGLEFDTVMIAGLEEHILPSYYAVQQEEGAEAEEVIRGNGGEEVHHRHRHHHPHQHHLTRGRNYLLEEERRLFYVGVTRAKLRLFLSSAAFRRDYRGKLRSQRVSRFVTEIEEHLQNVQDHDQRARRTSAAAQRARNAMGVVLQRASMLTQQASSSQEHPTNSSSSTQPASS